MGKKEVQGEYRRCCAQFLPCPLVLPFSNITAPCEREKKGSARDWFIPQNSFPPNLGRVEGKERSRRDTTAKKREKQKPNGVLLPLSSSTPSYSHLSLSLFPNVRFLLLGFFFFNSSMKEKWGASGYPPNGSLWGSGRRNWGRVQN